MQAITTKYGLYTQEVGYSPSFYQMKFSALRPFLVSSYPLFGVEIRDFFPLRCECPAGRSIELRCEPAEVFQSDQRIGKEQRPGIGDEQARGSRNAGGQLCYEGRQRIADAGAVLSGFIPGILKGVRKEKALCHIADISKGRLKHQHMQQITKIGPTK